MNRHALVIVDVQNDFCPGGALAVPGGDDVVPVINAIAGKFDLIVATQDWHPAGHISFASAHPGREPGDTVRAGGADQALWPDHCVQGSDGAAFHPDLDTRPVKLILRKGMNPNLDSYSGFLETDHATNTGLAAWLQGMEVDRISVCGLATDYCVYFTAMDAVEAGFETRLITDACRGIDLPEGNLDRALKAMRDAGVAFVESGLG